MRQFVFLLVLLIALGLIQSSAGAAEHGWTVTVFPDGSGEASVSGEQQSSIAVRCDPRPRPTLSISYVPPPGIRLPVREFWNIAIHSIGYPHSEIGGLYLFDELEDGGRAVYRLRADDSMRDEDFFPFGPLEDAMHTLQVLQLARRVVVTSAESDASGLAPSFEDELSLAASYRAITAALTPGGCAAMLDDAWDALEASY